MSDIPPTLDEVIEAYLNSWHTETVDLPRDKAKIALLFVAEVAVMEERRRMPVPELLGG